MKLARFVLLATSVIPIVTPGVTAEARQHESHNQQMPPPLVRIVREATAPFRDPQMAIAAGYVPKSFCVSGPEQGAMGVHFVNPGLVKDGLLDPEKPEALVYEPKDGRLRLVAAEFIVFADSWHAHDVAPPALFGQLLNYIAAPNRYGNPNFYEIHVWAWKDNPFGEFVDWNPSVSCADHPGGQ